MGGDSLEELITWHNPDDFIDQCDEIGVFKRPFIELKCVELERVFSGITGKIRLIKAPLLEISSSEIRERIYKGMPYQFFLPLSVNKIIQTENEYLAQNFD